MTLHDTAREAVAELHAATGRARFTVRPPTPGPRPWVVALAVAAVIAIPIMWSGRAKPVAGPPIVEPPTAPEALVSAVYAAVNAQDDAAIAALAGPNARHGSYRVVTGPDGVPTVTPGPGYAYRDARLSETGLLVVEVTDAPLVAGYSIAVPVRYVYADEVLLGFDVFVVTTTPTGLRIAGGATFVGGFDMIPDPDAAGVIARYRSAWNEGDASAVMDSIATTAVFWDDIRGGDPDTAVAADEVEWFIATRLWFDVEMTGPAVISGPFLAIPNQLIAATTISEGISIFLIHDRHILLHAFAQ